MIGRHIETVLLRGSHHANTTLVARFNFSLNDGGALCRPAIFRCLEIGDELRTLGERLFSSLARVARPAGVYGRDLGFEAFNRTADGLANATWAPPVVRAWPNAALAAALAAPPVAYGLFRLARATVFAALLAYAADLWWLLCLFGAGRLAAAGRLVQSGAAAAFAAAERCVRRFAAAASDRPGDRGSAAPGDRGPAVPRSPGPAAAGASGDG